MTLAELPRLDQLSYPVGQLEESDVVGDRTPVYPDLPCKPIMGIPEILDESLVDPGNLDGVQVLPLKVFDEGKLKGLAIVSLLDNGRNLLKPRNAARPEPALSCDDFISGIGSSYNNRLNNTVLLYGCYKALLLPVVKVPAGLKPVGRKLFRESDSYSCWQ